MSAFSLSIDTIYEYIFEWIYIYILKGIRIWKSHTYDVICLIHLYFPEGYSAVSLATQISLKNFLKFILKYSISHFHLLPFNLCPNLPVYGFLVAKNIIINVTFFFVGWLTQTSVVYLSIHDMLFPFCLAILDWDVLGLIWYLNIESTWHRVLPCL